MNWNLKIEFIFVSGQERGNESENKELKIDELAVGSR